MGILVELTLSCCPIETWLRMLSNWPGGPLPTSRSRCNDLSSCVCFVNCVRGLAAVEHSAPPKKDITESEAVI